MKKLYRVAKTRPGADCGSDHELLITKFRLKLKKVGKTARPFRYDLNKIPYDYTEEVRNRFTFSSTLALPTRRSSDLYSQQKQDRELTVAQIMNSLLPNSDSN